MYTILFLLIIIILGVIKIVYKTAFKHKKYSFNLYFWILFGLLFILGIVAYLKISLFMSDYRSLNLREYGSESLLFIITTLFGYCFALFGKSTFAARGFRIFAMVCVVPMLILSIFYGLHLDSKKENVFFENAQFRIEKHDPGMYIVTLPNLIVKKGIWEQTFSLSNKKNIPQEIIKSATIEQINSDSLNIIFTLKEKHASIEGMQFIEGRNFKLL